MIEASEQQLISKAQELNALGSRWHFHLLTPDCGFNERNGFVLILEDSEKGEQYFNDSEKKQEQTSKLLLELLHGIKADEKDDTLNVNEISDGVRKIESRAKELIEKGIRWHHHALFPDCVFNDKNGKWKIILEDPETREVLESVTDYKPEEDLKIIEPLFYHQDK
jgi:hypothetical protein